MKPMDCTDVRVVLSGLVDDELDAETRYAAERHVAQCAPCADLVSQAEALDGLVVADAEAWNEGEALPEGFVGAVLSRTVYGGQTPRIGQRWTTWAGWVAAAAALVMAMTVWVMDRRLRHGGAEDGATRSITPMTYRLGDELRSSTWTWPEDDGGAWPAADALPLEHAETLYTTSIVLEMLAEATPADVEEIERMRRIIDYDELLVRLTETRDSVDDADLPAILATERVLATLALAMPGDDDLRVLRETALRLDLPATIGAMSDRRPGPPA